MQHRIGGLEKADGSGNISYDPDNHDRMVRLRQSKIDGIGVPSLEVDDPSGSARLLVLGWGSTYGPIGAACRALRKHGKPIAQAHLLLRARFLVDVVSYTKVAGTPFMESELVDVFAEHLGSDLAEAA